VCLALLAAQCKGAGPEPGYQPQPSAVPKLELPAWEPTGELPGALNRDTQWLRAAAGDPMDLSTLARAQGAAGLLAWIAGGQRAGWVALHAFAFAEDAAAYQGELCELLPQMRAEDRMPALDILLQVVTRSPSHELDAGRERCARVLGSGLAPVAGPEVDLRQSVAQALAADATR
jgi:hypothetical protein